MCRYMRLSISLMLFLLICTSAIFHTGCGRNDEEIDLPLFDLDGDGIPDSEDKDADGDGWAKNIDCNDLDSTTYPEAKDLPDISYEDSNCDGVDGDSASAVWISTNEGDDAAPGTVAAPVKTLARAIAIATSDTTHPRDIYVVEGTYAEDTTLTNGIGLYGGYSMLTADARTRNIEKHLSVIAGEDYKNKVKFNMSGDAIDLDYTLLVSNSDSTIQGLTINGDAAGVSAILVDSSAKIQRCTISDSSPTTPRDASLGIVAIASLKEDGLKEATVSDSIIEMRGTGSTNNGYNYGIIALQEKGADKALKLTAERNRIRASGSSKLAAAIIAADADSDPNVGPNGDSSIDMELLARSNDIFIEGNYNIVAGIVGGSFLGGPIIESEPNLLHLHRLEVMGNKLQLKISAGIAVGINAGLVRKASTITNNAVRIEGTASSGVYGFLSLLAPVSLVHNSFSISGQPLAMGAYFAGNDTTEQVIPYAESIPGDVINNIFDVEVSQGNACSIYGIAESTMGANVNNVNIASPSSLKNNDIFLRGNCQVQFIYHDVASTNNLFNEIVSISDLNSRQGFRDDDPMASDENIEADPLFISALKGDLRILQKSPCRDTGLLFELVKDDLLGQSRPQGKASDIGAYEQ